MNIYHIPKNKIYIDKDNYKNIYNVVKRTFDILSSGIFLILTSPFLIYICMRIKIQDKGPILYSQIRIGKDERPFTMYKFRSMHVDADKHLKHLEDKNEVEGLMFKIKDDPRITPFGRWLRKHSFDEIPQLINVIKGDMSLIGPRPPLPDEVKDYNKYQKQKFVVKPGCSGVWQVTYRNNISFEKMIQQDLWYIKNRNLMLDLKIIFKTIEVMVCPNGLYLYENNNKE